MVPAAGELAADRAAMIGEALPQLPVGACLEPVCSDTNHAWCAVPADLSVFKEEVDASRWPGHAAMTLAQQSWPAEANGQFIEQQVQLVKVVGAGHGRTFAYVTRLAEISTAVTCQPPLSQLPACVCDASLAHHGRCLRAEAGRGPPRISSTSEKLMVNGDVAIASRSANGAYLPRASLTDASGWALCFGPAGSR